MLLTAAEVEHLQRECRPHQKQVTVWPTSPPPVISVWVVRPGQSRVVGALRGQAPSLVWQPVHFRGGASLHCAQHHFSAYTTPVHGNGRHRASSASASAITTPTHRSHIHRMAVPPRVNPAKRTYQCRAGQCCAGPKRHAYIYIHLDCFSALCSNQTGNQRPTAHPVGGGRASP